MMPLWWFATAPPLYFLALFIPMTLLGIYALGYSTWKERRTWKFQVVLSIVGVAFVMTWEILVNYLRSH